MSGLCWIFIGVFFQLRTSSFIFVDPYATVVYVKFAPRASVRGQALTVLGIDFKCHKDAVRESQNLFFYCHLNKWFPAASSPYNSFLRVIVLLACGYTFNLLSSLMTLRSHTFNRSFGPVWTSSSSSGVGNLLRRKSQSCVYNVS
jgi:hypothetical protein